MSHTTHWAFVSGQILESPDGRVAPANLKHGTPRVAQRRGTASGCGRDARQPRQDHPLLVRLKDSVENRHVRNEVLSELSPALTVIIAGIFDSAWLLDIEAVATA